MRGNPDHPYSKGELCPKVNKFLDRVYSDERVLHPLRRVGPKGEGRFEQITWDEALAEIAARFHEIIDRDGAEAIMPYSDAGNQSLLAMGFPERFWNRLGATRVLRAICGPTVGAGVKMTIRHHQVPRPAGDPPFEADHPVGHQHQADQPAPLADHRRGPRRRRAGRRHRPDPHDRPPTTADWFIQPLPGTDIALMLAMMHVLIRDGLTDNSGSPTTRSASTSWPRTSPSGHRTRRRDLRRAGRRHRAVGDVVRHDPPGGDPHADRRRAPRERGDVLPHPGLPSGAGRRVARPRRRPRPLDRRVDRIGRRRQRPASARRCSPAASRDGST